MPTTPPVTAITPPNGCSERTTGASACGRPSTARTGMTCSSATAPVNRWEPMTGSLIEKRKVPGTEYPYPARPVPPRHARHPPESCPSPPSPRLGKPPLPADNDQTRNFIEYAHFCAVANTQRIIFPDCSEIYSRQRCFDPLTVAHQCHIYAACKQKGGGEMAERLIPLLPVRLDIDLRNATVSAGGLRKSQRSPCLIRAFQQWEGTQHHVLPEPRG